MRLNSIQSVDVMIEVRENGERNEISMDEFLRRKTKVGKFDVNRKLWLLPDGEEVKNNLDDFERELKKLSEEIEEKNKNKNKNKKSKYCTIVADNGNYNIYNWVEN